MMWFNCHKNSIGSAVLKYIGWRQTDKQAYFLYILWEETVMCVKSLNLVYCSVSWKFKQKPLCIFELDI